eukprot:1088731-Pelagomonas_calceolata.AAC.2
MRRRNPHPHPVRSNWHNMAHLAHKTARLALCAPGGGTQLGSPAATAATASPSAATCPPVCELAQPHGEAQGCAATPRHGGRVAQGAGKSCSWHVLRCTGCVREASCVVLCCRGHLTEASPAAGTVCYDV